MLFGSPSLFLLLLGATATVVESGYDAACLYPADAPEDLFEARDGIVFGDDVDNSVGGRETPYVIHVAHEITMCQAACTAYHSPGMFDPLTLGRKPFTVPEFGQNGYSIIMCLAQCVLYTSGYAGFTALYDVEQPSDRQDMKDAYEKCGANGSSCNGPCRDLCNIIKPDYNPYDMGHWLGLKVKEYFDNDGWNSRGDMTNDWASDEPVECTASCRNYQDTWGYAPRPDPRTTEPYDEDSKYVCEGDCRRWQPLQEGDSLGSLKRQEFVAPHIGYHAKTYLRNASITLDDPDYDLKADSDQVIEEVKITSGDDYRKDQIQLMDNKIKVRYVMQEAIKEQFATSGEMSFQEFVLYLIGVSTAEIDGVVQTWLEKVHHDLVRPTTVIKYWNDDELFTFGGDMSVDGPVNIKARDFEATIRVMPHGEFPSGSSCLCKLYQEFTDVYLEDNYGRSITNFPNTFNDKVYADMNELRQICGDSRVWGGLHYAPAVPAGEAICEGLGTLGAEWATTLRNGSNFKNPWYRGTPRPVCNE
jgi:hypothetical protein